MPGRSRPGRAPRPLTLGLAAAGVLLVGTVALLIVRYAGVPAVPASASAAELERLKLLEEVRQLRISNGRASGGLGLVLAVAPLATVIGGLGAGLVALFQVLHQRRQDSCRRADELMATTLAGLGADSEARRAASAAALNALTHRRPDEFTPDMFEIVTSQLRVTPIPASVATPLSRILERLLPGKVAEHPAPPRSAPRPTPPRADRSAARPAAHDPVPVLDLAHLTAVHLDMHGLDLRGWDVDVAYSTLKRARLEDTRFRDLHGYQVILTHATASRSIIQRGWLKKAVLTGAILHDVRWDQVLLDEADLTDAQFQNAELHQAKLRAATLRRTSFAGADIREADFRGIAAKDVDEATVMTLLQTRAQSWQSARFDPDLRDRLQQRSAREPQPLPA